MKCSPGGGGRSTYNLMNTTRGFEEVINGAS